MFSIFAYAVSPRANLTEASINQTFSTGNTATLECTSLGGPGNTYQWRSSGEIIPGRTSAILILSSVVASTGGLYTCVVSNDAGMDTADTYVLIEPYFLSQVIDTQTSLINSPFQLLCDAVAFPSPEYLWERVDGREIRSGIVTSERNLSIPSLQYGDEGGYYCNATANGVTVQFQSGLLTRMYEIIAFLLMTYFSVVSPEVNLAADSVNITYARRDTATLVCNSLGGPGNVYQWQFNGLNISGENSSVLTVADINASHGGIYSCVVSNTAGEDSADSFVFVSPYFVSQPIDQQALPLSSLILECGAQAFPVPEFQWQRGNGGHIRNDIMTTAQILNISSVLYGDEGEYYCTAFARGTTIQSRQIIVTGIVMKAAITVYH
jgi:hypothetical protein